jgi:hypothetical protein
MRGIGRHYNEGRARGTYIAVHFNVCEAVRFEELELHLMNELGPAEDSSFSRLAHEENLSYQQGIVDYLNESIANREGLQEMGLV